jgi:hypothetical protein
MYVFHLLCIYISSVLVHRIHQVSITYIVAIWSRVLLEKLTGSQPVESFRAFYGTRKFITTFTNARHLSLSPMPRSSPYPHNPLPEDPS